MRRIGALLDRKAAVLQCETELGMQRSEPGLGGASAEPGDAGAPKAPDFVEREHKSRRLDAAGQTAQCRDAIRRLLAEEREREMDLVGRRRPAASGACDLAGKRSDRRAARRVGPYREEEPLRLSRRDM